MSESILSRIDQISGYISEVEVKFQEHLKQLDGKLEIDELEIEDDKEILENETI